MDKPVTAKMLLFSLKKFTTFYIKIKIINLNNHKLRFNMTNMEINLINLRKIN